MFRTRIQQIILDLTSLYEKKLGKRWIEEDSKAKEELICYKKASDETKGKIKCITIFKNWRRWYKEEEVVEEEEVEEEEGHIKLIQPKKIKGKQIIVVPVSTSSSAKCE